MVESTKPGLRSPGGGSGQPGTSAGRRRRPRSRRPDERGAVGPDLRRRTLADLLVLRSKRMSFGLDPSTQVSEVPGSSPRTTGRDSSAGVVALRASQAPGARPGFAVAATGAQQRARRPGRAGMAAQPLIDLARSARSGSAPAGTSGFFRGCGRWTHVGGWRGGRHESRRRCRTGAGVQGPPVWAAAAGPPEAAAPAPPEAAAPAPARGRGSSPARGRGSSPRPRPRLQPRPRPRLQPRPRPRLSSVDGRARGARVMRPRAYLTDRERGRDERDARLVHFLEAGGGHRPAEVVAL